MQDIKVSHLHNASGLSAHGTLIRGNKHKKTGGSFYTAPCVKGTILSHFPSGKLVKNWFSSSG